MLNIKDPEADRLVRELAEATGESITEAVREAARERLHRVARSPRRRTLAEDIAEIAHRHASAPVLDDRTPDEILGYDEIGLPH